MAARIKPRFPVFIHRPRIAVFAQHRQDFTLRGDADRLLEHSAEAAVIKPLIFLFASRGSDSADWCFLLRSTHNSFMAEDAAKICDDKWDETRALSFELRLHKLIWWSRPGVEPGNLVLV